MNHCAPVALIAGSLACAAQAGVSLFDDGEVGVLAEIRPGIVEPTASVRRG